MAGEMNAAMAAAEPVKWAYVTVLAGGDGACLQLQAVVQLAEDLRKVDAAYPLVVAVLPDVPESHRDVLVSQGCVVREVEPVYPPQQSAMAPRYVVNYSMLRIWEFVEFERIVCMDAGIRVLENIDKLFELEKGHFYASEIIPPPPAPYFNAGMFVHEPSVATAQALLDALRVTLTTPSSFPEQGFLSMFFRDQYKPIPLEYYDNLVRDTAMALAHTEDVQLEDEANKKLLLPLGTRLATKAAALARQNLPAMAILTASSAALGVVITGASSPVITFGFYAIFNAAMATVLASIRGSI